MKDDLPHLWEFLGGYLHQDWQFEYADWREAFDACADEVDPFEFIAEIDGVLALHPHDGDLADVLLALGSFFVPRGPEGTIGDWLRELRERCAIGVGGLTP